MIEILIACHIKWIALEPADEDGVIWTPDDPQRKELELSMALEDQPSLLDQTQRRLSPTLLMTERDDLGLEGAEVVGLHGPAQVTFLPYELMLVAGHGLLLKHTDLVFRLPNLPASICEHEDKLADVFSEITAITTFEVELGGWLFMEAGREDEYCKLTDKVPSNYTTLIDFRV